ncbi:MAG: hypothetical protein K6G12_09765 [Lachnospiraceae bacterium]|nr:hypothetical protein [Lachnospiraceae bacterium]
MKSTKKQLQILRYISGPAFMLFFCVAMFSLFWVAQYYTGYFIKSENLYLSKIVVCIVFLILRRTVFSSLAKEKSGSEILTWAFGWASLRTILTLAFSIVLIVSNCKAIWTLPHRGILTSITAIAYVAVATYLYEDLVFDFYCEAFEKRFCNSSVGYFGAIITSSLLSSAFNLFILLYIYQMKPSIMVVITVLVSELWLAQLSEYPFDLMAYEGRSRAAFHRFLMHLAITSSVLFFKNNTMSIAFPSLRIWILILSIMVLIILLSFRPAELRMGYTVQNERLISIYNLNDLFGNGVKKEAASAGGEDFLLSLTITVPIIIAFHFAVSYGIVQNTPIEFFRSFGSDVLGTLISVTFLLTSFLSFLSSRDDAALWTDTMEYKLVLPKFRNFRSFTIYAFMALLADIICFFLGYDILVAVFFGIGILMLVILTFSMIDIFFHRKGIIYDLETRFFSEDVESQKIKLMDLHFNTKANIVDSDYKRLKENVEFLARVHNRYVELEDDLRYYLSSLDKDAKKDSLKDLFKAMKNRYSDMPKIALSIYAEPETAKTKRDDVDRLINSVREIDDEVLYQINSISEEIIRDDIYLYTKILSETAISIMEQRELRKMIIENIINGLHNHSINEYEARSILNGTYGYYISRCFSYMANGGDVNLVASFVRNKGINRTWREYKDNKKRNEEENTLNALKKELDAFVHDAAILPVDQGVGAVLESVGKYRLLDDTVKELKKKINRLLERKETQA